MCRIILSVSRLRDCKNIYNVFFYIVFLFKVRFLDIVIIVCFYVVNNIGKLYFKYVYDSILEKVFMYCKFYL